MASVTTFGGLASSLHGPVASRKRPNHPSPVPSYRTTDRHATLKRARWDVSSPTPSPPILSIPLPASTTAPIFAFASDPAAFNFGFSSPTRSYSTNHHRVSNKRARASTTSHTRAIKHAQHPYANGPMIVSTEDDDHDGMLASSSGVDHSSAFERLRQSTFDEAELFVTRMREWEARSTANTSHHASRSHHHPAPASSVDASNSPPYMSNSITSTTSSGSGSGSVSEASSLLLAPPLPTASSRKRSWSILEDEEVGGDMEWEVVPNRHRCVDIPQVVKRTMDVDMAVESTSMHGDDEQEDSDDSPDSEDDDDLIFVIGDTTVPTTHVHPHAASSIPTAGTERMIAELSQVLAAGAGGLEDAESGDMDSEDAFVDVGAAAATRTDAGALWN